MKSLPRILLCLSCAFVFVTAGYGQKLNLKTQTKAAPGANYVGLSGGDNYFDWVPVSNLNALLADEVLQGSGAPSGAPTGLQGWIYVNTDNGAVYTWNGATWVLQGLSALAAVNGLTKTGQTVKLGGSITEATTLNAAGANTFNIDSTTLLNLRARSGGGSAHSLLSLSHFTSGGANVSSSNSANGNVISNLNVRPTAATLSTRNNQTRGAVITSQNTAALRYSTISGETETTRTQVRLDSTGTYLDSLKSQAAGMTQMLYINPTTFEIGRGAAPTGTIGGSVSTTQIPVGSGTNTVSGSSALTFSSSTLNIAGEIVPSVNNNYRLGTSSNKWSTIYAASGVNIGSFTLSPMTASGNTFLTFDGHSSLLADAGFYSTKYNFQGSGYSYGTPDVYLSRTASGRIGVGNTTNATSGQLVAGKIGAGQTTPTALVHLGAGTAAASTAPLKFAAGTNMTATEAGAVEYDGTEFYGTTGSSARTILARVLKGSATLDFPSTAADSVSDLTVSVPGAVDGDPVYVGVPNGSTVAGGDFTAWVSAADTVKIRFANNTAGALDPPSGVFKVTVNK